MGFGSVAREMVAECIPRCFVARALELLKLRTYAGSDAGRMLMKNTHGGKGGKSWEIPDFCGFQMIPWCFFVEEAYIIYIYTVYIYVMITYNDILIGCASVNSSKSTHFPHIPWGSCRSLWLDLYQCRHGKAQPLDPRILLTNPGSCRVLDSGKYFWESWKDNDSYVKLDGLNWTETETANRRIDIFYFEMAKKTRSFQGSMRLFVSFCGAFFFFRSLGKV